jgi:capsular polysaccharide biosynthesis protein
MLKEGKMKTLKIIIILSIFLALAMGYIAYIEISKYQVNKQISVYQQGAQAGYEQAILLIAQQASTCQPVPLIVENQTINLIAVECLQQ